MKVYNVQYDIADNDQVIPFSTQRKFVNFFNRPEGESYNAEDASLAFCIHKAVIDKVNDPALTPDSFNVQFGYDTVIFHFDDNREAAHRFAKTLHGNNIKALDIAEIGGGHYVQVCPKAVRSLLVDFLGFKSNKSVIRKVISRKEEATGAASVPEALYRLFQAIKTGQIGISEGEARFDDVTESIIGTEEDEYPLPARGEAYVDDSSMPTKHMPAALFKWQEAEHQSSVNTVKQSLTDMLGNFSGRSTLVEARKQWIQKFLREEWGVFQNPSQSTASLASITRRSSRDSVLFSHRFSQLQKQILTVSWLNDIIANELIEEQGTGRYPHSQLLALAQEKLSNADDCIYQQRQAHQFATIYERMHNILVQTEEADPVLRWQSTVTKTQRFVVKSLNAKAHDFRRLARHRKDNAIAHWNKLEGEVRALFSFIPANAIGGETHNRISALPDEEQGRLFAEHVLFNTDQLERNNGEWFNPTVQRLLDVYRFLGSQESTQEYTEGKRFIEGVLQVAFDLARTDIKDSPYAGSKGYFLRAQGTQDKILSKKEGATLNHTVQLMTRAMFGEDLSKYKEDGYLGLKLVQQEQSTLFLPEFTNDSAMRYYQDNIGRDFFGLTANDIEYEDTSQAYANFDRFLHDLYEIATVTSHILHLDGTEDHDIFLHHMDHIREQDPEFCKRWLDQLAFRQVFAEELLSVMQARHDQLVAGGKLPSELTSQDYFADGQLKLLLLVGEKYFIEHYALPDVNALADESWKQSSVPQLNRSLRECRSELDRLERESGQAIIEPVRDRLIAVKQERLAQLRRDAFPTWEVDTVKQTSTTAPKGYYDKDGMYCLASPTANDGMTCTSSNWTGREDARRAVSIQQEGSDVAVPSDVASTTWTEQEAGRRESPRDSRATVYFD